MSEPNPAADSSYQRLSISVPVPSVTLNLGSPSSAGFGYPGYSVATAENSFVSVDKVSLVQIKGAQTEHVGGLRTSFAKGDYSVSGGAAVRVVSKKPLYLVAGPGYAEEFEPKTGGAEPYAAKFDDVGVTDLVGPLQGGVRDFDVSAYVSANSAFRLRLGIPDPPSITLVAPPDPIQAALDTALAVLQRALVGVPEAPTRNSVYIDAMFPNLGGLVGVLQKVNKNLRRLSSLLTKPDALPLVGPVLGKIKDIQGLIDTGAQQSEVWSAFFLRLRGAKSSWTKDKGVKGGVMTGAGEVVALIKHYMVQVRAFVRVAIDMVDKVTELITTLTGFLNIMPAVPAAVGIFGKQGVTIGAADRFFAFATDGFHFLSAPKKDVDKLAQWDLVGAAQDKIGDLSFVKKVSDFLSPSISRPQAIPGFFVETTGPVKLMSTGDEINLDATGGAYGVLRMRAHTGLEVASGHALGLSARSGPVEVLGHSVHLGSPPFDDVPEVLKQAALLDATFGDVAAANKAINRDAGSLAKARGALMASLEKAAQIGQELQAPDISKRALLQAKKAEVDAKVKVNKAEVAAKELALATANVTRDAKHAAALIAQNTAAPSQESTVGRVCDDLSRNEKQLYAHKVQAAAVKAIELYAGVSATVESRKIALTARNATWEAAGAATGALALSCDSAKMSVGAASEIALEKAGADVTLTLKVGAATITVVKDSIEIAVGTSKIKVQGASIDVDGGASPVNVKGSQVNLQGTAVVNIG